jgi:cellobiose-specific phosphotransferase system component IIA
MRDNNDYMRGYEACKYHYDKEIAEIRTQLAAAQQAIAEACHEMDCSSVQDSDSSLSRAWQLLQDASDRAMQEKT